jgi:hypothetical protein
MTIYNGIDFQMWFKIFLLLYSSAWSFSTNLLSRLSMCYIQRQPSLPAHENRQVTAISYSLALFLLVIHTLLHYFRIIDKRNLSRWSASSLVLKHNYTAAKQSSYWRSKVTVFLKIFSHNCSIQYNRASYLRLHAYFFCILPFTF